MTHTLAIVQDEYPANPREEFDQASRFVCFHKRYDLGDKHTYRSEDYDGWDGLGDQIDKDGAVVILPLYLYDHSGITIATKPFSCPWDSGQVGFVYMTKNDILDNFSTSVSPRRRLTPALVSKALYCVEGEVEEYNQYLTGDVWCYDIKDEDGNVVDSCCGLYGYKYAEESGNEVLASFNNQAALNHPFGSAGT
jgi:hypothetical protein